MADQETKEAKDAQEIALLREQALLHGYQLLKRLPCCKPTCQYPNIGLDEYEGGGEHDEPPMTTLMC